MENKKILLLLFFASLFLSFGFGAHASTTMTEGNYRWRNDDGSETAATWKNGENKAYPNLKKGIIIRLRFLVYNAQSTTWTATGTIQYTPDHGANWTDIPATATTEHFELASSSYFSDGDATTAQLTAPSLSYTFVAGKMVESPTVIYSLPALSSLKYTEMEIAIKATANAVPGTNYEFRAQSGHISTRIYTPQAFLLAQSFVKILKGIILGKGIQIR